MIECLKAAKNTHQFLLATCGVYLLGRMQFGPDGDQSMPVTFLGYSMPNLAYFSLIAGVVSIVTLLRWYVYLERMPIKEQGQDYYEALHAVAWPMLWSTGRAAGLLNLLEWALVGAIFVEISGQLRAAASPLGYGFGALSGILLILCYWRMIWMGRHLEDAIAFEEKHSPSWRDG